MRKEIIDKMNKPNNDMRLSILLGLDRTDGARGVGGFLPSDFFTDPKPGLFRIQISIDFSVFVIFFVFINNVENMFFHLSHLGEEIELLIEIRHQLVLVEFADRKMNKRRLSCNRIIGLFIIVFFKP